MLTVEEITKFGFKEGRILPHDQFDRCWHFMLRDEIGKKFQVTIKFWKFSKYSTPQNEVIDSFSAECQFDMNGPRTFDVDISVKDMTPQEIVDWFNNMFEKMGCTYYERYDE